MSAIIYQELIEAGAPELPEGYTYKITQGTFLGAPHWTVRVQYKVWWGWKTVGERRVYAHNHPERINQWGLVGLLAYAADDAWSEVRYDASHYALTVEGSRFVGRHP